MTKDYDNYFRPSADIRHSKRFMVQFYARFPWLAKVFRTVRRLPRGSNVLDLGAGEGHFLATIQHMRPDLHLVASDLKRHMIHDSLHDIPFISFDIDQESSFPRTNIFDLVVSQHVLEHLNHPTQLFRTAFDALKPGGLLYVECPDVRWTLVPHLPFLTGRRGGLNFWDDPTHKRPYSRASLRKLSESNGFEVLSVFYVRKWGHLLALPMALTSTDDDYRTAFLHPLLGLWCGVLARKQP